MKAKLSTEVPIPHLYEMDEFQDYGYALSYLCDQPDYLEYFKHVTASGRPVVLDNSYNELLRSEGLDRLFAIYEKLSGTDTLLIAPDNKKRTDEDHYADYHECRRVLGESHVIFVAFRQSHYDFAEQEGIPHVAIAFPQRPAISNYFHSRGIPSWMTLHYLGFNHPAEYEQCHYIDTTLPLKLVYLNQDLYTWRRDDFPHYSSHLINKLFHKDILTQKLRYSQLERLKVITRQLKDTFA